MSIKHYLVIGKGYVGSSFESDEDFFFVSHNEFDAKEFQSMSYDGYVYAAGLAGKAICEQHTWDEVVKANVDLPMRILKKARRLKKPFVAMSTGGVYRNDTKGNQETDDVHPCNRYTASLLLMEKLLLDQDYKQCYIFRISCFKSVANTHPNHIFNKMKEWTKVEAVNASVTNSVDLIRAVRRAFTKEVPAGIYNVASDVVWMPDFVKKSGNLSCEIVAEGALNSTPLRQLNITKAQSEGLI